jgi:hypothetical protein
MITGESFEKMALSFPNTGQKPHFDRIAFKVIGKRVFATYFAEHNTANIFLSSSEQKRFAYWTKRIFTLSQTNGAKMAVQPSNWTWFQENSSKRHYYQRTKK